MPKDQYQHFLPRFILRYFQDAQSKPQTKKERRKRFWKDRKTGTDSDTVLMYELARQTFEARPISKIYGATNLYRDARNRENVDHLEEAFSRLENDAAVILKNIHSSLEPTSHTAQLIMKRKDLNTLRKFLFLMYQRTAALVESYYDENHPDNAPIRNWLKASKEKAKLKTNEEMWLECLRYNLFTPHHQIVAEGETLRTKHGTTNVLKLAESIVDSDITSWFAIDYESLANGYFLGVWEAAIGEEFILTDKAFGLWEGFTPMKDIPGQGALHRLFVVSPRIALVLRSCYFPLAARNIMMSDWLDIPMEQAACQYANFKLEFDDEGIATNTEALWAYRTTHWAQEDTFTSKIVRLTESQTQLVNHTILLNARVPSSVTFSSTTAMINTIRAYLSWKGPFGKEFEYLYRSLLGTLLDPIVGPTIDPPRSPFDIVLGSIVSGVIEFPSMYNRAYRIYHLATDDTSKYARTSSEIHKTAALGINKLKARLGLPDLMQQFSNQIFTFPLLAQLPKEESELFFALAGHQIDQLGLEPQGGDMLEQLKYEAAVIGVVHWIAAHQKVMLQDWLYPWVNIFDTQPFIESMGKLREARHSMLRQ